MNLKRKRTNFQQSQRQKEPDGCLWYKWKYAGVLFQQKKHQLINKYTKSKFENKDKKLENHYRTYHCKLKNI